MFNMSIVDIGYEEENSKFTVYGKLEKMMKFGKF